MEGERLTAASLGGYRSAARRGEIWNIRWVLLGLPVLRGS